MSDYEDDSMMQNGSDDQPTKTRDPLDEEEEEDDQPPRRSRYEDDEDEEDEEEEEGPGDSRTKKKTKRRHRRSSVSRFIDFEAEVSDDEEEEDYDDEDGHGDFLAPEAGDIESGDLNRRAADYARLNRRERELDDQDLAALAEDYSRRAQRPAMRYSGDLNDVPQRLLMPSVHDANLWQVRVKPGKERDLVFSLMRKAIDTEYSARPLQVLSAFQRDSLPGMIYVEARSAKQVNEACQGLVGIYPSRGIALVPIEEMASLLQIKKQEVTVTPGSWVRIKRGKYQGDIAQVLDVTENGEDVGLKFIPRIDLNPKDEPTVDGKKRKKQSTAGTNNALRPPQRFFNYEEVIKVYGRKSVARRNQIYLFQNDQFKDGFIEKDFRLTAIQLDNVNPTLDEITRFTRGQDGTENDTPVDLSIIAEASRKAAIAVLQPGDHVEVFEGEQSGVQGTVQSVEQDIVTITPVGVDFDGQKVQIPARSVRKRFKPGDHVKVMTGTNADETGLVVSVSDNIVTFLSDMSLQEVSVFSKDLREAAEVGSGTNIVGNYELHDLVQLDPQTVGVIYKTERDSFRVLDQNGQTRLVKPHQISMRRDSIRAVANDAEGHELRINDNVKEADGLGRKGRVIHIHQSFYAFLHNRDVTENSGVFVTRARSLVSLAPKGNLIKTGDLSKMNPSMMGGGMVGSGMIGRGPRDRLIGTQVMIIKGPSKGVAGVIKDTNGTLARVELLTGNKVISIDKSKLKRRRADGTLEDLDRKPTGGDMRPPSVNPHATPRTPAWKTPAWQGGMTPNVQNPKTPAWQASSRTPNPYLDGGGKTPAWSVSSRTPNPYADGGKTPAWSVSSRTPNPYAGGGGGGSGWSGGGGGNWSSNSWGGQTPGRTNDNSNDWQADTWGAPTPREAPTPYDAAPTPAFSVPTPGYGLGQQTTAPVGVTRIPNTPGYFSAQTPGVFDSLEDEFPEEWILKYKDKLIGNKPILKVRGSGDWADGKLEKKEFVLLDVTIPRNDYDVEASATVALWDNGVQANDTKTIPVRYLHPISPSQNGATVAIFMGPLAGKQGIVRSIDADTEVIVVQIFEDQVLEDTQKEYMTLCVADHFG